MMRNGWQRIVAGAVTAVAPLAVTLALGTAVVWAAPLAHADPGDAGLVQQLSAAGINITDPPPLVGNTARSICGLLRDGWTVGTALYSAKGEYPFLSDDQARTFVLLSQKNYCPNA
jgi:hypothetical protein